MVAALILGAACTPAKPAGLPHATVPTAPTTTDPYARPAVVDEAYVNRVLAGLDQVVGEALRIARRNKAITPEVDELLRAIYTDARAALPLNRQLIGDAAARVSDNIRPELGNQVSTVSELLSVRYDCIFARVHRDLSPLVYRPNPDLVVQWVGLTPLDPQRDPRHLNPTPWAYLYDGFPSNHRQPPDPCAPS